MLRDVRIVRLRCAWCLTRTNHLNLRVEAHLHSWQRPTNLSQLYRLGYQTKLAVPMVRRRQSKNTGIRGLFYTYAIFIFSIRLGVKRSRLGFGYILKQVLCQEHSWFAVGIFRRLEARSSASRQKISMDALVTVRSRNPNMDAEVTVCSWNPNGSMVWAWMRWSPNALGTRMELWLWRGCSGHCMAYDLETRTQLWFGHVAKTQATALHPLNGWKK